MFRDIDSTKWIFAALLVFHIAWIANHMRLVAAGQINPWKLGGYGMYTVPQPTSRLLVIDAAFPRTPTPVNLVRYLSAQRFRNPGRVFLCDHIPTESIRALIYENRNLIGRRIAIFVVEIRFVRKPPSIERIVRGYVTLTWQDMHTFNYVSRFCGTEHAETAKWDE